MAISQTAISYYGFNYVEHAVLDFKEMVAHGCTTVILAVTEFDFDFWRPNIPNIVNAAHECGLRVLIDPWGIGKFFGGEQISKFLQDNINNRQVSAITGETLPAACFNTASFRDYFNHFCVSLAKETDADGFFWDECHYALPNTPGHLGEVSEDWTCRCPVCMKKFEEKYGYEMPKRLTEDVIQFRENEALVILSDTSKAIKEIKPGMEITCCVHATERNYYVKEHHGFDDWDKIASCPYFDVFSSTIIDWNAPWSFFKDITRRTVEMARKYNKLSERWITGYYTQPEDFSMIDKVADLYSSMGIDRLGTWTYRGGYGTACAAPDALKLWDRIGENYKRLLQKSTNQ